MKAFSSAAVAGIIIVAFIIIAQLYSLTFKTKEIEENRYFQLEEVIKEQSKLVEKGEESLRIYCNGYEENNIETKFQVHENCTVILNNITTKNCIFDAYEIEKNYFSNNQVDSINLETKLEQLKQIMESRGYKCSYSIENLPLENCDSTRRFEFECELGKLETKEGISMQMLKTIGGVR